MLIKFRIKHPKLFKILKEGGVFLLIFIIVFAVIFTMLNGRAFYQQVKYKLKIGVKINEDLPKRLPFTKEELYDVPNSITIPKINVNAPIVFPQTTDEKILFNELENGVVHYPTSILPGRIGNTIILGHSSAYPWYKGKYGSVFSLLNQLESGDQIIIFYQKHKYIYKVTSKEVVKKNATPPEQNEISQIILISCWPVGTAWNRILIKGVYQIR